MYSKIKQFYYSRKNLIINVLYVLCNAIAINSYYAAARVDGRNSVEFGFFVANLGNLIVAVPVYILYLYKMNLIRAKKIESSYGEKWIRKTNNQKIGMIILSFVVTAAYIFPTLIKGSMLSVNSAKGIGILFQKLKPGIELKSITQSQLKVFSGFSVFITAIFANLFLKERSGRDFYLFGVGYIVGSIIIFRSKSCEAFDYSFGVMFRIIPYVILDSLTAVFGRYFSRLRINHGMDIMLIFTVDLLMFFLVGLIFLNANLENFSDIYSIIIQPWSIAIVLITTIQHCLKLFCQIEAKQLKTLIIIDCFKIPMVWFFDYLFKKRAISQIAVNELMGVFVISLSLYLAKVYKYRMKTA